MLENAALTLLRSCEAKAFSDQYVRLVKSGHHNLIDVGSCDSLGRYRAAI